MRVDGRVTVSKCGHPRSLKPNRDALEGDAFGVATSGWAMILQHVALGSGIGMVRTGVFTVRGVREVTVRE